MSDEPPHNKRMQRTVQRVTRLAWQAARHFALLLMRGAMRLFSPLASP
jgi:hypothetical protein